MNTVLITGCSSGFGRVTAELLAQNGMLVLAAMRNTSTTNKEVADELSAKGNIEVFDLDLSDMDSIQKMTNIAIEKNVEILINNAGVAGVGLSELHEVEKMKKIFEINVFGTYELTRSLIPYMRNKQAGLIITVSSIVGRIVMPNWAAYSASKFALEAIAETWRYELAPLGIESVIMEPGPHPTTALGSKMGDYSADMPAMEVFQQYGPVAGAIQQFHQQLQKDVESGNYQKPESFAEAMLKLIQTPKGQRPFRTVVDKQLENVLAGLNNYTDEMYKQMFMS